MTDQHLADRRWRDFVRGEHDLPAKKPAPATPEQREAANEAIRGVFQQARDGRGRYARRRKEQDQ